LWEVSRSGDTKRGQGKGLEEGGITKVQVVEAEDFAAPVVGVEVHVECVNIAVALVVDDDGRRHGVVCLSLGVGFGAFDPGRVRGDVVLRSQIYVGAQ
jgi:hypothetical protein